MAAIKDPKIIKNTLNLMGSEGRILKNNKIHNIFKKPTPV